MNRRLVRFAIGAMGVFLLAGGCASVGPDETWTRAVARLDETQASIERVVLDNGLTVLMKSDACAPVAAVQIWVGSGAIHQDVFLGAGLCHALEHMIFKGTPTRGPVDITRDIHDVGGKINAYTSLDRTVFHVTLPSRHWRVGLDVLTDAVRNALFPEEEWTREREVIRREIAMNRDNPDREIGKLLWATAFRAHPYRHPVIGHETLFDRLTAGDLATFARAHYVPDNMTVVVVGDIPRDEMVAGIRAVWDDAERRLPPPLVIPEEPTQVSARSGRREGAYTVSRVEVAYHTVSLSHPDAAALDVLADIVGQGRSSWLNRTLKEGRALVHAVSAWSYTPLEAGLLGMSATFAPEREAEVLTALEDAVNEWTSTLFPVEAIAKARRRVIGDTLARLATMDGQASSYASGELYAGDPRFDAVYVRRVADITATQLRDVARRYLRPENRTRVVLAPEREEHAAQVESLKPEPIERIVLSSGVPVLVRPDHRLPLVYVCAALGGGVLAETEATAGLTRVMSELLMRGTTTRSREALAERIESTGSSLSPFSGWNSFGLQGRCFSSDLPGFMDLVADCLLRSTFPEEEIAKQKMFQKAALDEQREQPFLVARTALLEQLFPKHPYRLDPLGTAESIDALTREALRAYRDAQVGQGNLVLAVFGDVTADEARRVGEATFSRIGKAAWTVPTEPMSTRADGAVRRVQREPKEQAIILMGFPGVSIFDPRVEALSVLSTALSGLSSSLAVEVRDVRGLAYYVGAFEQTGLHPGLLALYAGTHADAVVDVESLFLDEVRRLVADGLSDEEMERSRNRLIADFDMDLQNNGGLAMNASVYELYGLGVEHFLARRSRFGALTRDAVREAAASVLATNRMAVSIVVPEEKAERVGDESLEE